MTLSELNCLVTAPPFRSHFGVVAFVSHLAAHPRMQFGIDFAAKPRSVSMAWVWHVSDIHVTCLDDSGVSRWRPGAS
jgi:hypothetical protein